MSIKETGRLEWHLIGSPKSHTPKPIKFKVWMRYDQIQGMKSPKFAFITEAQWEKMAPTNRRSQSFTSQTETKLLNLIFTEFREALSSTENYEASMLLSLIYMPCIQVAMKVNFANTYAQRVLLINEVSGLSCDILFQWNIATTIHRRASQYILIANYHRPRGASSRYLVWVVFIATTIFGEKCIIRYNVEYHISK